MDTNLLPSTNRKDLRYLRKLPRSPLLSYLKRQLQPTAPRLETAELVFQPARFPIQAFSPSYLWNFIVEYLRHRLGWRHPFQNYAPGNTNDGVYEMRGDGEIRIVLAGDWATGTDEASSIAKLMTDYEPHYSIHLGDVYYVGHEDEVNENFLGITNPENQFQPCLWPKGTQGSFALNGNHEMYSLGYGYFRQMLPALGPIVGEQVQGQTASFFCLENEYWRVIALDTGYNSIGMPVVEYFWPPDCALPGELLDWLRTKVKPFSDDKRGIILLSHHQYFSRFEEWYPRPAKQLAEFFSGPVLWFWGHEHRMAIYQEFGVEGGIRAFGRCIGHGGMPVELPPPNPPHPECVLEFVDDRQYLNDENLLIGFNGFARMALREKRMNVEYVDVHGRIVFYEAWEVQGGTLMRVMTVT